jgi:lysophospholipase L1-like esterase
LILKNNNPDGGLLLISLLLTVVLALMAGLIVSADSTNPIETLMFFVRDGVTSAVEKEESNVLEGEITEPVFIPPTVTLPAETEEEITVVETTSAPEVTTKPPETTSKPETTKAPETTKKPETTKAPETTKVPETTKAPETTKVPETTKAPQTDEEYFSDTLFLGDSRTVGFYLYAKIPGATYFARTSMNVYNVFDDKNSETKDTSAYNLSELLSERKFGKIYILLGINEIGYSYSSVVKNYSTVIDYIRQYQPDAKIIIQSNMHVTKKKSDSNPNTFSNSRIDELNRRLAALADNKKIFYIGFEEIFDGEDGAMSPDYSGDGVHLYAKCYKLWRDWILENGKIY